MSKKKLPKPMLDICHLLKNQINQLEQEVEVDKGDLEAKRRRALLLTQLKKQLKELS